jgi:large subunit ribosomal protein L6
MSRVGRKPIPIPQGVKVSINEGTFLAEGPKGKVAVPLLAEIPVAVRDGQIEVSRTGEAGPDRAKHGLIRALLNNAVTGVVQGFTKELEIVGVGYKAEVKGDKVNFALGYSHPIAFPIPAGISVTHDAKANRLTITGPDRQVVGQVAAEMRKLRKPDPYKGKGIKYRDEVLRRKVGKAGAK